MGKGSQKENKVFFAAIDAIRAGCFRGVGETIAREEEGRSAVLGLEIKGCKRVCDEFVIAGGVWVGLRARLMHAYAVIAVLAGGV